MFKGILLILEIMGHLLLIFFGGGVNILFLKTLRGTFVILKVLLFCRLLGFCYLKQIWIIHKRKFMMRSLEFKMFMHHARVGITT